MKQYKVVWLEDCKLRQFSTNNQNAVIDVYCHVQKFSSLHRFYDNGVLI